MKINKIYLLMVIAGALALLIWPMDTAEAQTSPHFQKVVYVVLENKDYKDVMKNSLFNTWANQGANFSNFFAETHPSQPNYIAMIAGDTLGVVTNDNYKLEATHLGDLLEKKQRDWRVYAEDYPGNCFLGASRGAYARKHVPFLSFANVQLNPSRCAKVTDTNHWRRDWQTGNLSDFSLIIPNNKSNGHDTDIATAATWINNNIIPFIRSGPRAQGVLVVITFDEGGYTLQNQIYTIFMGSMVQPRSVNKDKHNHFSLLRLIEDEWGLGSLRRGDFGAPGIQQVWQH